MVKIKETVECFQLEVNTVLLNNWQDKVFNLVWVFFVPVCFSPVEDYLSCEQFYCPTVCVQNLHLYSFFSGAKWALLSSVFVGIVAQVFCHFKLLAV